MMEIPNDHIHNASHVGSFLISLSLYIYIYMQLANQILGNTAN